MKKLRSRLTYANVISTLCLFLLLAGGSAIAANQLGKNSVGAKQLKKNAVTTAKVKANAITGAKIKPGSVSGSDIALGTLGTVPSATSATNAGTVNGQSVIPIYKTISEGQAAVIAAVSGFTFTGTCGDADADVVIDGPKDVGFAMEAGGVPSTGANRTTEDYEGSKPGEGGDVRVDELTEGGDASFGISFVAGGTTAGRNFSGVLQYDYETFNHTPADTCLFVGHLISG